MQSIALFGPFSDGHRILARTARGKFSRLCLRSLLRKKKMRERMDVTEGREGGKEEVRNEWRKGKVDRKCCVMRIHFPIRLFQCSL